MTRVLAYGRALALWVGAGLLLVCLPGLMHAARAANVSCTFAGPTLNFPTVQPFTGYPYSASGNVGVTCTNPNATAATIYGCISLGTGSGGTAPTNRTLASGGNTLAFQLTGSPVYTSEIGDGTARAMAGPFSLSIPASSASTNNFPLAGKIPTPGSTPPPGSYSTTFTGTDAQMYYLTTSTSPGTCGALVAASPTIGSFTVTLNATVPAQCLVTATGLTFPASSILGTARTATATVTSTCNTSLPVSISLDNGVSGTGPAARVMKSGANAITYGIYQNAGMTQPWGSTSGTNTQTIANGTGSLTAYGQVPAQTSPAPGTYTDTVNVMISY